MKFRSDITDSNSTTTNTPTIHHETAILQGLILDLGRDGTVTTTSPPLDRRNRPPSIHPSAPPQNIDQKTPWQVRKKRWPKGKAMRVWNQNPGQVPIVPSFAPCPHVRLESSVSNPTNSLAATNERTKRGPKLRLDRRSSLNVRSPFHLTYQGRDVIEERLLHATLPPHQSSDIEMVACESVQLRSFGPPPGRDTRTEDDLPMTDGSSVLMGGGGGRKSSSRPR